MSSPQKRKKGDTAMRKSVTSMIQAAQTWERFAGAICRDLQNRAGAGLAGVCWSVGISIMYPLSHREAGPV